MATLFERVRDLQLSVIAEQIPSGNGVSPAPGSFDDAFYGTGAGADGDMIWLRSGIAGFTPTTYAQMNRLRRGHIVLHPRFRLQVAHLGAPTSGSWAHVLDDQILFHMPADQAYSLDEVDTLLPADWADHISLPSSSSTSSYTDYLPVYTKTPAWLSYPGDYWVHTADIMQVGVPFYTSQKSCAVAPKAADARRPFCNAFLLDPANPATTNNIFNGWGSGTPVWMLVKEPGATESTVVRLGGVSWSGGWFEWIHAGLVSATGRNNPSETRTLTQVMNDLATASGDDPMAGSYTWSGSLTTANLSETPAPDVAPQIIYVTATPNSGTAPLTSAIAVGVTGDPTPTLVVTKNSGSGPTQIGTTASFSHAFGAGNWTVEATATNTAGSDTATASVTVTAPEPEPPPEVAGSRINLGGGTHLLLQDGGPPIVL